MMAYANCCYGLLILTLLFTRCQNPQQESGSSETEILHEELESESDTQELVPDSTFTSGAEGPAVSRNGDIFAVNINRQGTIGKVTSEGQSSIFVTLPDSSIGNGIRFLSNGDMLIADYPRHNILRVNMQDSSVHIWVHEPKMNQPNDLAITSKDVVFASDPNWSESTGNLWRIDPDGVVNLLESDMGTTNGIEVSPDEHTLYVNESVQRNVWAYDLSENGEISNKRLLIQFPDYGMDGMRCDLAGNLYITRYGKGTVVVVSPDGEILREVKTNGKSTSNIAFGGEDGKTCYVTLQDRGNIETFRAEQPGRAWALIHGKSNQSKR